MATGLIGAVGANSTFTYTSQTNCKIILNTNLISTNQSITLNGVSIFAARLGYSTQMFTQTPLYLAAGQTISIATSSGGSVLISSYEE